MNNSVLIVGRGASAHGFDWSAVDCPVMAVSSGIFAIPRSVHVDHFVTLDEPKCFMAQLMNHCDNAWGNDQQAKPWPFWTDHSIVKHVVKGRMRTVDFIPIPFKEIMEVMREWADANKSDCERTGIGFNEVRDAFYAAFGEAGVGHFGFQPGWGDYQNMTGWTTKAYRYPRWEGTGPLACWKSQETKDGFMFNSLLAAVQIAHRLGFKTLKFIGVDLLPEAGFGDSLTVVMKAWHAHAVRRGYEWINLSPISRLGEFMPGPESNLEPVEGFVPDINAIAKERFGTRPVKFIPIVQDGMCGFDIIPQDEVEAQAESAAA